MNGLTFILLTPKGELARAECACVTFFARDNDRGEGGGSMGIRRGHTQALAALEEGSVIKLRSEGRVTDAFRVSRGFAGVKDDVVTVAAEDAERLEI